MQTPTTNAPNAHTTTRRSLLLAAPAGVAIMAIPSAAVAATLPDRSAWMTAMQAYERADAESLAFDQTYFRIHDAWEAGRPSMDTIHWKEFPFADLNQIARTIDLDNTWKNFLAGEGKWWWGGSPAATERRKAKQRAALDSVQAFRDAEAQHNRDSGMDKAEAHSEELSDRLYEATKTLLDMPAPDAAALGWKLNYLFGDESASCTPAYDKHYVAQTFADCRRLLGGA